MLTLIIYSSFPKIIVCHLRQFILDIYFGVMLSNPLPEF